MIGILRVLSAEKEPRIVIKRIVDMDLEALKNKIQRNRAKRRKNEPTGTIVALAKEKIRGNPGPGFPIGLAFF